MYGRRRDSNSSQDRAPVAPPLMPRAPRREKSTRDLFAGGARSLYFGRIPPMRTRALGLLAGAAVLILAALARAADPPPAATRHWAYVKPVRPEVPSVARKDWVRTPIDAFVLARLEREGLEPSPEASKETL